MKIKNIMDKKLPKIFSESTVKDAAIRMSELKLGAIMVEDDNHNIKGIVSERDIMNKVTATNLPSNSTLVKEIMVKDVISINHELEEKDALRLMEDNGIRHLPAVDSSGNYVGMLGIRDIMRAMLKNLEEENETLAQYIMADGPGG